MTTSSIFSEVAVFSPRVSQDATRRESGKWLASMFASRLIMIVDGYSQAAENIHLIAERIQDNHREAVEKDAHLVKLALDHGKLVVSSDGRCKSALDHICGTHGAVKGILWIDPQEEAATAVLLGAIDVPAEWIVG